MKPEVTIYTTPWCSYCHSAKALLDRKGVAYREIDVSRDPAERQHMTMLAGGRRTVPQIFVGTVYLSDCDGMYELERRGVLDARLEPT